MWPCAWVSGLACAEGASVCKAYAPGLGSWRVLLGGDTQPALDGELAAHMLLPVSQRGTASSPGSF